MSSTDGSTFPTQFQQEPITDNMDFTAYDWNQFMPGNGQVGQEASNAFNNLDNSYFDFSAMDLPRASLSHLLPEQLSHDYAQQNGTTPAQQTTRQATEHALDGHDILNQHMRNSSTSSNDRHPTPPDPPTAAEDFFASNHHQENRVAGNFNPIQRMYESGSLLGSISSLEWQPQQMQSHHLASFTQAEPHPPRKAYPQHSPRPQRREGAAQVQASSMPDMSTYSPRSTLEAETPLQYSIPPQLYSDTQRISHTQTMPAAHTQGCAQVSRNRKQNQPQVTSTRSSRQGSRDMSDLLSISLPVANGLTSEQGEETDQSSGVVMDEGVSCDGEFGQRESSTAAHDDDQQEDYTLKDLAFLQGPNACNTAEAWLKEHVEKMASLNTPDDDVEDFKSESKVIEMATKIYYSLLTEPQEPDAEWSEKQKDYYNSQQEAALASLKTVLKTSFGKTKTIAYCIRLARHIRNVHTEGVPAEHLQKTKGKSTYGTETGIKCSERYERVIKCVRKNKQISIDITKYDAIHMIDLARAPAAYLRRKRVNTGSNGSKKELYKAGRQIEKGVRAETAGEEEQEIDGDTPTRPPASAEKEREVNTASGQKKAAPPMFLKMSKKSREVPVSPGGTATIEKMSTAASMPPSKSTKRSHAEYAGDKDGEDVLPAEGTSTKRPKASEVDTGSVEKRTYRRKPRFRGLNFP